MRESGKEREGRGGGKERKRKIGKRERIGRGREDSEGEGEKTGVREKGRQKEEVIGHIDILDGEG